MSVKLVAVDIDQAKLSDLRANILLLLPDIATKLNALQDMVNSLLEIVNVLLSLSDNESKTDTNKKVKKKTKQKALTIERAPRASDLTYICPSRSIFRKAILNVFERNKGFVRKNTLARQVFDELRPLNPKIGLTKRGKEHAALYWVMFSLIRSGVINREPDGWRLANKVNLNHPLLTNLF